MERRTYLGLALAGGVAGCLGLTDGGDERDGAGEGPLTREWETTLGPMASMTNYGVSVADGAVFVGSDAGLTALELSDGDTRWKRESWQQFTEVHADGDGVVALTREDELVSVDPVTGDTNWEVPVVGGQGEDVFHPSGLTRDTAIVSTDAGTTFYDRVAGDVLTTRGEFEREVLTTDDAVVLNGGFDLARVATDGSNQRWEQEVRVTRGGTIADGLVVAPDSDHFDGDHSLVAVDIERGDIRWEEPAPDLPHGFPSVAVTDGIAVYMADHFDEETDLYAHDIEDGTVRWSDSLGDPLNPIDPVAGEGVVIGEDESDFVAFDATSGERIETTRAWNLAFEGIIADGYVLACGNEVTAYRL